MHDRPRSIEVAVIGLPEHEQRLFSSLTQISSVRARAYVFGKFGELNAARIMIVDRDQPHAVEAWRTAFRLRPVPSIAVSADGRELRDCVRAVKRPLVASRLLSLLDEVYEEARRAAVARAREEGGAATGAPTAAPAEARTRSRALIVDDSPTARKHIELALRRFGLEIEFAESGEQALRRLAERPYDIVFLDVVLPGTDGYQVCKAIKASRAHRHIPVVMLTSNSSPIDRIRGLFAGCDMYLTKPVQLEAFEKAVRRYVAAIDDRPAADREGVGSAARS